MYDRALTASEVRSLYAKGNLDDKPPVTTITSRVAMTTLSGVVTVGASALDDREIAGVQFWLDGAKVGSEVTSAPYQVRFHTGGYVNGPHVLRAVARDTSGNTTPSAPVATTFANATAWLGKTMAIGNSLTDGCASESAPPDREVGYRQPLWERVVANPTVALDFIGCSNSDRATDWTTGQLTSMVPAWFASNAPDNVLLLTGTTDLLANADPERALRQLASLLDEIHATSPSARILVASIPGVTAASLTPSARRIDAFNDGIPQVVNARASQGWTVRFVDLYRLAGLSYAAGSADFGPDGIHPSRRGYEKISSLWYDYLLTLAPAAQR
jgi:lysophospholipase L1-like esterase